MTRHSIPILFRRLDGHHTRHMLELDDVLNARIRYPHEGPRMATGVILSARCGVTGEVGHDWVAGTALTRAAAHGCGRCGA